MCEGYVGAWLVRPLGHSSEEAFSRWRSCQQRSGSRRGWPRRRRRSADGREGGGLSAPRSRVHEVAPSGLSRRWSRNAAPRVIGGPHVTYPGRGSRGRRPRRGRAGGVRAGARGAAAGTGPRSRTLAANLANFSVGVSFCCCGGPLLASGRPHPSPQPPPRRIPQLQPSPRPRRGSREPGGLEAPRDTHPIEHVKLPESLMNDIRESLAEDPRRWLFSRGIGKKPFNHKDSSYSS